VNETMLLITLCHSPLSQHVIKSSS